MLLLWQLNLPPTAPRFKLALDTFVEPAPFVVKSEPTAFKTYVEPKPLTEVAQ